MARGAVVGFGGTDEPGEVGSGKGEELVERDHRGEREKREERKSERGNKARRKGSRYGEGGIWRRCREPEISARIAEAGKGRTCAVSRA